MTYDLQGKFVWIIIIIIIFHFYIALNTNVSKRLTDILLPRSLDSILARTQCVHNLHVGQNWDVSLMHSLHQETHMNASRRVHHQDADRISSWFGSFTECTFIHGSSCFICKNNIFNTNFWRNYKLNILKSHICSGNVINYNFELFQYDN